MTTPHQPAATGAMDPAAIAELVGSMPPARWSRRFTQAAASVTLRADHAELITTAATTLYAYRCTKPAASRWTITLHTGVRLDHAQANALFADGADHDIGPRLTARSITVAGGRAFWIPDRATLVHLDHTTSTITAHCADLDTGMHWAARLVRQAMTTQLLQHNAIYAHTAALIHRGIGVLIAGPKGAGKTTTLLSVLRLLGGDFVTNDRLLLLRDGDTAAGHAWPMHLRADAGTLLAVPGMSTFLPNPPPPTQHDGMDAAAAKIAIEPDELRRWLPGGTITGTVRPSLMLWPYRTTTDVPPERIAADQIRDTITRTQFFMHDPQTQTSSHRNHWLLGTGDPKRTASALADIANLISRTVPCFRIPVTDPTALVDQVHPLIHAQHIAAPGDVR